MQTRTRLIALTVAASISGIAAAAQAPPAQPAQAAVFSDAQQETFLRSARIARTRSTEKGVTNSVRATLTDGTLSHDAHIQTVDDRKREFASAQGVELDFVDSWTYNVAAYRLDRMLGLHLVPVSVERRWRSDPAAFTWWVDDVLMDEGKRLKDKIAPPDAALWVEQMQLVRLFDQLIHNVDRNVGNVLITRDWRVWAIDHTRAFRTATALRRPENITRCDRQVLERLKQLDRASLERELGEHLDRGRIQALLARRDAILKRIESLGPNAIFDRSATVPLRRELQLRPGAVLGFSLAIEDRSVRDPQSGS